MTRQARAVVIGGGIMGVSVAYHLAAEGWTDVILCEKGELTSGSTWHAAGQIAHAVGSRTLGWVNNYSMELYQRLETETGQAVGWHGCGGLRVGYDDDEVDWLKSIMNVGRVLDLQMELVGPDGVREANPHYNVEGVRAAVRTFTDGHVDPSGATQAMAAAARALGATVERHNRVTGVERRDGGEWRVRTEKADIIAEHVVIAAGSFAPQVGAWFGLKVPSVAMLHNYFVTDTVPEFAAAAEEMPVMRDNTYGGYIRQEQKSGLIGVYEDTGARAVWLDGVPWDSENELFEADYDGIAHFLERAFDRMPILADLGIRRVVRGAIPYTPDGPPLVGPAPGLRNVWMACGSSIGIAWGGGTGKLLADTMVHGEAEYAFRSMDPRRFGAYATHDYIVERAREDFEIRHYTPVPGYQRRAGRPWIRTPIHDRLAAAGAVFGEAHGYERPRWFARDGVAAADSNGWRRQPWHDAVAAECAAVRDAAGLLDLTAFSKFEVTGRHAARFLDRISANPPPARDGRVKLAHLLTPAGNFETELTVTRLAEDRFYLGSSIAAERRDLDWLRAHVEAGEDVSVANLTHDRGFLALSGPGSRDILARVTDCDLSNEVFPWLSAREARVAGLPCLLLRVSFTGELGFELHMPLAGMAAIYDALHEAGDGHGLLDIGSLALNALRLEKAYPGGSELTPEIGLVEAGMLRFFRPDNRRFIGREATIERIAAGPSTRMACLAVDAADADCHGGECVLFDGRPVGMVSSGGYGHRTSRSYAFAFVEPRLARAGTALEVVILEEHRAATVLDGPTYDPTNRRIRS